MAARAVPARARMLSEPKHLGAMTRRGHGRFGNLPKGGFLSTKRKDMESGWIGNERQTTTVVRFAHDWRVELFSKGRKMSSRSGKTRETGTREEISGRVGSSVQIIKFGIRRF
jgi:hypothetical protein